ncbi:MAG: amino acid racemase [Symploca sp. SIO2B6]|nr:amino acid racemase [Symploca sp. SIO2B6]
MTRPMPMKTIGILGGMSNQATAEYYRMLNEAVNERLGSWDIAETLIQGVNFGNIEYFIRNEKWDEARDYLTKKAIGAQKGGADLLLCVSNTMHRVLDDISDIIDIPFIHISDPTGQAIVNAGLSKVGLIGTKSVMEACFISDRYKEKYEIDIVTPSEEHQILVDQIIFDELVKGKIIEASIKKYVEVCRDLENKGAQGIILGCTEIFLLLKQSDIPEIPMFNTTELHVKAAVDMALEEIA